MKDGRRPKFVVETVSSEHVPEEFRKRSRPPYLPLVAQLRLPDWLKKLVTSHRGVHWMGEDRAAGVPGDDLLPTVNSLVCELLRVRARGDQDVYHARMEAMHGPDAETLLEDSLGEHALAVLLAGSLRLSQDQGRLARLLATAVEEIPLRQELDQLSAALAARVGCDPLLAGVYLALSCYFADPQGRPYPELGLIPEPEEQPETSASPDAKSDVKPAARPDTAGAGDDVAVLEPWEEEVLEPEALAQKLWIALATCEHDFGPDCVFYELRGSRGRWIKTDVLLFDRVRQLYPEPDNAMAARAQWCLAQARESLVQRRELRSLIRCCLAANKRPVPFRELVNLCGTTDTLVFHALLDPDFSPGPETEFGGATWQLSPRPAAKNGPADKRAPEKKGPDA